ncbi:hypothetical protein D3C78_1250130 [compost metagenome]
MVGLGVVERRCLADLGGDGAVAGAGQFGGVGLGAGARFGQLRGGAAVDRRAVLGAAVVALTHALGRVVGLPEHLEQGFEAGLARIEDHPHHLGMSGQPGAHLLVARVGREAAGVARRRHPYARLLPQAPLGAPETAQAELHFLEPFGEWRLQRVAVHIMQLRHRHRAVASRQCLFGAGQLELVDENL